MEEIKSTIKVDDHPDVTHHTGIYNHDIESKKFEDAKPGKENAESSTLFSQSVAKDKISVVFVGELYNKKGNINTISSHFVFIFFKMEKGNKEHYNDDNTEYRTLSWSKISPCCRIG